MSIIPSHSLAQPLQIGSVAVPNRVFLAPMSGVTDEPFRKLAESHGAGLTVSEMVASGELAKARAESGLRLRKTGSAVHMVQLAGRQAEAMHEAARIAEGEGADIIDINMGCPAKKVTGGYSGSALMRDLDHALTLIDAVVGAVAVPVTLKMRLGWDDGMRNAPELARRAEQAGVQMITVHGRTRCQFYEGKADWSAIAEVKAAISVPLVANGDIDSPAAAEACLAQTGADAVMIGRAAYGQPWLPGEIADGRSRAPADLAQYVIAHYDAMLGHYGVERGLRHARKHLGWYLDRHAPFVRVSLRRAVTGTFDPAQVRILLTEALACRGDLAA